MTVPVSSSPRALIDAVAMLDEHTCTGDDFARLCRKIDMAAHGATTISEKATLAMLRGRLNDKARARVSGPIPLNAIERRIR